VEREARWRVRCRGGEARDGVWSLRQHGRAATLREVSFLNGWGQVRVDELIRITIKGGTWVITGVPPLGAFGVDRRPTPRISVLGKC
jgi:hypothetical protein